ncbi:PIN domain-containing protein [Olsenella sp. SW781]|nr:PIN domain-containing protein [Olsenella sp. SW781]
MLILDASAGCALSLGWPEGKKFEQLMYEGERALAPQLYIAEIIHVFQKHVRGGKMAAGDMQDNLARALRLVDEFVPMEDLCPEVLSESVRLRHSSYDMFYLVLARRTGGTLLTIDRRLVKLALENGVSCAYGERLGGGEPWTIRADLEEGPGRAYARDELLGRG